MSKFKKVLAAIMLTAAVMCTAGFVSYNGNQSQNGENMNSEGTKGHDYVDLGLPSGTLWATCNVGADTPEGYGDYFAWGETTSKTNFTWLTCKYANNGDRRKLTKYCNDASFGNNGFTDKLTVLQASDDAATANWGKGWRTPTKDEWQELKDNTTSTWTTKNGVQGRLFTASNGRTLFLPAVGYHSGDKLYAVGNNGTYWSSSLETGTSGPHLAWYFFCNSGNCNVNNSFRAYGRCVRPVRSSR